MKQQKDIVIISDCYGSSNSGAKLIQDLKSQFEESGYGVVCFSSFNARRHILNFLTAIAIAKASPLAARAMAEITSSIFLSLVILVRMPRKQEFIINYSPSIFLFMAAFAARMKSGAKVFLILRDLFPQWLMNEGSLKPGKLYRFLLAISFINYRLSHRVGAQSETDIMLLKADGQKTDKFVVLKNWRTFPSYRSKRETSVPSKSIRVLYAGNVGRAQNMDVILPLLLSMNDVFDLEISVYGFGESLGSVRATLEEHRYASKIEFHEPVFEEALSDISQSHDFGLVALDDRLQTGNVPGKIPTYLSSGLGILAICHRDSEVHKLISKWQVGICVTSDEIARDRKSFAGRVQKNNSNFDAQQLISCLEEEFSTRQAVETIKAAMIA